MDSPPMNSAAMHQFVPPVGGVPIVATIGPALRPHPIVSTGDTSRRGCDGGVPPSGGTSCGFRGSFCAGGRVGAG